jgi:hypothetical protein
MRKLGLILIGAIVCIVSITACEMSSGQFNTNKTANASSGCSVWETAMVDFPLEGTKRGEPGWEPFTFIPGGGLLVRRCIQ